MSDFCRTLMCPRRWAWMNVLLYFWHLYFHISGYQWRTHQWEMCIKHNHTWSELRNFLLYRQPRGCLCKLNITRTMYYHSVLIICPSHWLQGPPCNLQITAYKKWSAQVQSMSSNWVGLQIIFCSCMNEITLFSFLRSLLCKNGRSLAKDIP